MKHMRAELIEALRRVTGVKAEDAVQTGTPGFTAPLAAQGVLGWPLVGEGYLCLVPEGVAAVPPQGSRDRRARAGGWGAGDGPGHPDPQARGAPDRSGTRVDR